LIRPKLLTAGGDQSIYIGEQEYTSGPGTYYFKVPNAVTRIHACCIGAGAQGGYDGNSSGMWHGGGGGGLGWKNNIEVEPGETLVVQVGAVVGVGEASPEDGDSWIKRMEEPEARNEGEIIIPGDPEVDPLVAGFAPAGDFNFVAGGKFFGDGGGDGGSGSLNSLSDISSVKSKGSGGGAGGYTGRGGDGCTDNGDPTQDGGGGSGGASWVSMSSGSKNGYRGGGTGVRGKGESGASRRPNDIAWNSESLGGVGYPGSGGEGRLFGAGGAGERDGWSGEDSARAGHGAVRIIWGNRFSYPDNADVEAE